jgi:GTP-binding protein EngB required for normal cell division
MNITPKKSTEAIDSDGKIDEEFVKAMLEIEKHYSEFNKHDKIRIEQWSKKLCQIKQNPVWKQNRNNYALIMLHCVKKGALEEPFTKVPPEDSLPALNSHIVV